jgi:hypothetical protein
MKKGKNSFDINEYIDLKKFPIDLKKHYRDIPYCTKDSAANALYALEKKNNKAAHGIGYTIYKDDSKEKTEIYIFLTNECLQLLKDNKRHTEKEEKEAIEKLRDLEKISLFEARETMNPKIGYVDILTDLEVIEVKAANRWKEAVGQIMVYRLFYPNHAPRIHLFFRKKTEKSRRQLPASKREEFQEMVEKTCQKLTPPIRVTLHSWHLPDNKENELEAIKASI